MSLCKKLRMKIRQLPIKATESDFDRQDHAIAEHRIPLSICITDSTAQSRLKAERDEGVFLLCAQNTTYISPLPFVWVEAPGMNALTPFRANKSATASLNAMVDTMPVSILALGTTHPLP